MRHGCGPRARSLFSFHSIDVEVPMTISIQSPASRTRTWLAVLAIAGGSLALAACDKNDGRTAGEKLDSAVARTEQAVDTARDKTVKMAEEAKTRIDSQSVKDGAANAKEAVKDAGTAVANTVDDAAITAAISAGLAKDPDLSAIKIDVDTKAGAVSLQGPAPSAAAKERAEQIAKGVQGVTSVDNRLEVKG
jgi:hyperosmotically inducible periplasmic protein